MDIAQLSQSFVAFIAPLLPYLLKAGEKATDGALKKIGENAWEKTKALWGKLQPKIEAKPAALDIVQKAATRPHDERIKAALELHIEEILNEDKPFAIEFAEKWEEVKRFYSPLIQTGERGVTTVGNVTSSTIITGDRNRIK